jgi:tetratricopeptide (TPR) repeat protein
MSLAGTLVTQKKYNDAYPLYETVLTLEPSYIPAIMAIGFLDDANGHPAKAEARYREVLAIDPDHVNAANNLACILQETSEGIEEAFKLVIKARRKNPRDPNVLDTMGWVYFKKGIFKSAISEFEESLRLNPNNPISCYHMGMTYYQIQEYELARTYLQKAIDMDPDFNGANMARQLLNQ